MKTKRYKNADKRVISELIYRYTYTYVFDGMKQRECERKKKKKKRKNTTMRASESRTTFSPIDVSN